MAASRVALKRTLRFDAAIGSFSTRESPVIGWSIARATVASASITARAGSEQRGRLGPPSNEAVAPSTVIGASKLHRLRRHRRAVERSTRRLLLLASSAPRRKRPDRTRPPVERRSRGVYRGRMASGGDSFHTRSVLEVGGTKFLIHRLDVLGARAARLPFSLKILLENLLRGEDGRRVTREHVEALLAWEPTRPSEREIPFMPARVLLQDFTGVPAVVDLAAMRDAMRAMGGDPARINPLQPADLVIDHSVQVDVFGTPDALRRNTEIEFERNRERYAFLRWGQQAFRNFRVVPPDTGIVHQVNLEYLAPVVFHRPENGLQITYPDTVLGTDSHTTMINGLGVVGWGVGGIEAEAAMLGQPTVMLIPEVVGFRLEGRLAPGATATDVVLTVTEMLRKKGVVGKFVEFYGPGVAGLALADRATIGNMAPEYGATIGFFPIDAETLTYLRLSGRDPALIALVEAYARAQGLFRTADTPDPVFSERLELDLGTVEPSLAGPRRPQDRVPLRGARAAWRKALAEFLKKEVDGLDKKEVERWLAEGGQPISTTPPAPRP